MQDIFYMDDLEHDRRRINKRIRPIHILAKMMKYYITYWIKQMRRYNSKIPFQEFIFQIRLIKLINKHFLQTIYLHRPYEEITMTYFNQILKHNNRNRREKIIMSEYPNYNVECL